MPQFTGLQNSDFPLLLLQTLPAFLTTCRHARQVSPTPARAAGQAPPLAPANPAGALQAVGHPFHRWGDGGSERSWAWVRSHSGSALSAVWELPVVTETMGGQEVEPHSGPHMAGVHSSSAARSLGSCDEWSEPALGSGGLPAPGHPLLPPAQPSHAKLGAGPPLLCSLNWPPGIRTRPQEG